MSGEELKTRARKAIDWVDRFLIPGTFAIAVWVVTTLNANGKTQAALNESFKSVMREIEQINSKLDRMEGITSGLVEKVAKLEQSRENARRDIDDLDRRLQKVWDEFTRRDSRNGSRMEFEP